MLHMPGHHKEGLKPLIGLWGHTGLGSELIVTEKGFCVWHLFVLIIVDSTNLFQNNIFGSN